MATIKKNIEENEKPVETPTAEPADEVVEPVKKPVRKSRKKKVATTALTQYCHGSFTVRPASDFTRNEKYSDTYLKSKGL